MNFSWSELYRWAACLVPSKDPTADPENCINVSPSRLRRKSDPGSMIWETLPIIAREDGVDQPSNAVWPLIPPWAGGRLPTNRDGKLISTANARLRHDGAPFAPTFMGPWNRGGRVLVIVSWFYEFDSRLRPQLPYAVFPLQQPFWVMAGLASPLRREDGQQQLSVTIITVEPNRVLASVGHHRSPALLRDPGECLTWLAGSRQDALELLRPYPDESMGVEAVPMNIKIPGNENVDLPETLKNREGFSRPDQ